MADDHRELAEQRRFVAELSAWLHGLNWIQVRADFIREFGSRPTAAEATSFAVAKYGSDEIKTIWKRLH